MEQGPRPLLSRRGRRVFAEILGATLISGTCHFSLLLAAERRSLVWFFLIDLGRDEYESHEKGAWTTSLTVFLEFGRRRQGPCANEDSAARLLAFSCDLEDFIRHCRRVVPRAPFLAFHDTYIVSTRLPRNPMSQVVHEELEVTLSSHLSSCVFRSLGTVGTLMLC